MSEKRKISLAEEGNKSGGGKQSSKKGCGSSISSFASACCGMCCCDEEQMYHGFLLFCSLFVVISQATILNVYIIAFFRGFRHQAFTYFVFLGDLFVVCVFAVSFLSAYRYNHLRRKLKLDLQNSKSQQRIIRKKIEDRIYHSIQWLSRRFGTLPYLPFAWFVYSMFLVFKVGIVFTTYVNFFRTTDDNYKVENYQNQSISNCSNFTNITNGQTLYNEESVLELGPNLLKIAVGSTALVFIIILQAHHNHQDNTAHGGHMLGVCHNISVEVFDSVTLLSLLIDPHIQFNEIWSSFNKPIIVLSSLNLVFPTITLFSLTLSDFGRRMSKITRLTVTNQALQLFLINIPFLYVRLYLWVKYRQDLSMFVVKNLCYIFLLCHSLYPGMIRMFKECDRKRHKVKDFAKRKLVHHDDQAYELKDEDDGNESHSEQSGNVPISPLDQVDSTRPTSLYRPARSSMHELIPMTELSYEGTKDAVDGNKGAIKRRQDSTNIATAALVESLDSHSTNPNHRVSTSSASPTSIGSPSSPKSSNVFDSPGSSNSPPRQEGEKPKQDDVGRMTRL